MKKEKGFTLIELLVVIAIIGILAAIVLSNLNSARTKSSNADVKSEIASIRSQAAIYYDDNENSYNASDGSGGNLCSDSKVVSMLTQSAGAAGKTYAADNSGDTFCYVDSDGKDYVVAAPLKETEGTFTYWCADSATTNTGGIAEKPTGTPSSCNP